MSDIPDEMLMAYADGVLDAAGTAHVDARLVKDAGLRRRLEVFRRTTPSVLEAHFRPLIEAPVPERLTRAVKGKPAGAKSLRPPSGPISRAFASLLAAVQGFLPRGSPPLAAAFTLAVGITLATSSAVWMVKRVPASDPFGIALETAKSGTGIRFDRAGTRVLTPVMSFEGRDGRYCRQYVLDRTGEARLKGVACRDDSRVWRILFEAETGGGAAGKYVTASGEDLTEQLEAFVKGTAYGRAEEDALLRKGWQRGGN